ncbi:hypothetical protein [Acinetobacter phage Ab69]|nr:hypothetical protein [Acinetobacter phage Ab69]
MPLIILRAYIVFFRLINVIRKLAAVNNLLSCRSKES